MLCPLHTWWEDRGRRALNSLVSQLTSHDNIFRSVRPCWDRGKLAYFFHHWFIFVGQPWKSVTDCHIAENRKEVSREHNKRSTGLPQIDPSHPGYHLFSLLPFGTGHRLFQDLNKQTEITLVPSKTKQPSDKVPVALERDISEVVISFWETSENSE